MDLSYCPVSSEKTRLLRGVLGFYVVSFFMGLYGNNLIII